MVNNLNRKIHGGGKDSPAVYDGVEIYGRGNIGNVIMYAFMDSSPVRTVYFGKDVCLHFFGMRHRHKKYYVRD